MISALLKYASDQGLYSEPGFKRKSRVKWALRFDGDGNYQGIMELGDITEKKNAGATFDRAPHLTDGELNGISSRLAKDVTSADQMACHFLIESASVVTGPDDADVSPEAEKARKKHRFFVKLLADAATAIKELGSVAVSLRNEATLARIREDLKNRSAKPTDSTTLMIGTTRVVEMDAWHDWWRQFRAQHCPPSAEGDARMVCLASGDPVAPAATQPAVNISDVGGQPTGSKVVSFDKTAFPSYGLEQSANAAMSTQVATAYADALQHVLDTRGVKLAGSKVAYWYSRPIGGVITAEDDPLGFLFGPGATDEEPQGEVRRIHELLNSVREGKRPDLAGAQYYALTVSGTGGRVMVRSFDEGRFEDLVRRINSWFDDLAIVRRDGRGPAPYPGFFAVLAAAVRDIKDVPSPYVVALWHSALTGQPIPRAFVGLAVTRARLDIVHDQLPNHARMGLIKAFLVRKGDTALQIYLNEEHPSPAYHAGRLMAVLARLQHAALGDVGAGVVQRYYASASSTPALVLGRLTRLSQYHLSKLEGGLANYFEKKISAIWARIRDGVPATLSLEEQSLFAMGYYQQMAADWRTKEDKAPEPSAHSDNQGEQTNE